MFNRMLVPIDGSHSSASVVPYAGELAKRLDCEVDLLLVEPTSGAKLPHPEHHRPQPKSRGEAGALVVGSATPAYVREANERYVARHIEEFEALGVRTKGQVVCGDAVEQILHAALEQRCDVIAMASRKLAGAKKRDTGSIAEQVLRRSRLPVLLIAAG